MRGVCCGAEIWKRYLVCWWRCTWSSAGCFGCGAGRLIFVLAESLALPPLVL